MSISLALSSRAKVVLRDRETQPQSKDPLHAEAVADLARRFHSSPISFSSSMTNLSPTPSDPSQPASPPPHKYSAKKPATPPAAIQPRAHRHTSTETPSSPDDKTQRKA